jgi:serine O-acetyltransferase
VNPKLRAFKRAIGRFWILSPERLWLLSIRLAGNGHWAIAFWVKQLNSFLYHNSLAPGATVSPDITLGHNSIGIVVGNRVTIGEGVMIWHNVTLTAGRLSRRRGAAGAAAEEREAQPDARPASEGDDPHGRGPRSHIVVEDHVRIGANCVVIAPRGRTLRIGRGAKIGAGTVLTEDVPPRATVVGQAPRVILAEPADASEPGVLSDAASGLEGER